jgi:glycosyltransferase involved in cell wall biosynthesis
MTVNNELVLYIPTAKGVTIWRDLLYLVCLKFRGNTIKLYYLNKSDKKSASLNYFLRYLTQKLGDVILTDKLLIENTLAPKSKSYQVLPLWSRFKYSIKEIHISKTVGFFSNNYRFKGIDVYEKIVKMNPEIEFIVAGAMGDYRIGEHDNLTRLGSLDEEKAKKFYKSIDILIYPSRDDCFPLTILEALSAGVFVLGSNVGAIPSLLDSGRGMVLEIEDFVDININAFWPSLTEKRRIAKSAESHWTFDNFKEGLDDILIL